MSLTRTDDPHLSRAERDRRGYLDYQRAAEKLDAHARHYAALAAMTIPDVELVTFGRPVANHLSSAYEGLAEFMALAAEQARTVAESYRAHLDGQR